MFEIQRADTRGRFLSSWLDSRHSFSFGHYYDPDNMGFSVLKVLNDDSVAPGAGFDTHGHRDMEIISLVTEGRMEHKDSMGNVQRIEQGEFQLMSAGSGVTHSEYNAENDKELSFLQIWIEPNEKGTVPGYQQKNFGRTPGLTPILSPDGANGTMTIRQQASLSQLILLPGGVFELDTKRKRVYLFQVEGQLSAGSQHLEVKDALKISCESEVVLRNPGNDNSLTLVFFLP